MQFLIIGRPKEGVPYKEYAEACAQQAAAMLRLQLAGKILAGGAFAGDMGGCYILSVESTAELNEILKSSPMFPYATFESYALVPFDKELDIRSKVFSSIKGA